MLDILPMRRDKYKFGQNRAGKKGSLFLRPSISCRFAAELLKHLTLHSLPFRQHHYKFGRNRTLMKGTSLLRSKQLWSFSRITLQLDDSDTMRGSLTHAPVTEHVRCVSGSNQGNFTLETETAFVTFIPLIAADWLKHHKWHNVPTRHRQSKFGRNWAVTKATLPCRLMKFFIPIFPCIAAG